jgi:hypothetical protein
LRLKRGIGRTSNFALSGALRRHVRAEFGELYQVAHLWYQKDCGDPVYAERETPDHRKMQADQTGIGFPNGRLLEAVVPNNAPGKELVVDFMLFPRKSSVFGDSGKRLMVSDTATCFQLLSSL